MAIVTSTLSYSLNVIKTQQYCTQKCARSSLRLPVFINTTYHIIFVYSACPQML